MPKKMKGLMKGGDGQFESFVNKNILQNIAPILYMVGISLGLGLFLFVMFWYITAVNSNSFGHLDLSETAQLAYYDELLKEKPITPIPKVK